MVNYTKSQITALLENKFTDRVRSTLSAMQGVDPSVYFTGTDVAHEIVVRIFKDINNISRDHFTLITERTNAALAASEKSNNFDIHRSTKKITSVKVAKILTGVRKAYGYRIGKEVKPVVDTAEMKLNIAQYVLDKLTEMETEDLLEINQQIGKLLNKRYAVLNRKIKELHG